MALLVAVAVLTGCGAGNAQMPEPSGVPEATAETSVFFSTGRSLVEEPRVVDAKNVYKATLDELLAAQPAIYTDIAIVQPEATINTVALDNGTITLDWSREVLQFEAEDKEQIVALAAFLRTLGQFPEVQKVRFTVEGKTEGTIDGKDVAQFWGHIGLNAQPWDVLRAPVETTGTAGQPGSDDATGTASPEPTTPAGD